MSGVISSLNRNLFLVVPGDSALIKFITDDANPSWNNGSGQTGFSFSFYSVICPYGQYVSTDTGLCQGKHIFHCLAYHSYVMMIAIVCLDAQQNVRSIIITNNCLYLVAHYVRVERSVKALRIDVHLIQSI